MAWFADKNVRSYVFKGLALLHLAKHKESEECYRLATQRQPHQPLAWQGLEKFYTETQGWEKLAEVLQRQMDLAVEE